MLGAYTIMPSGLFALPSATRADAKVDSIHSRHLGLDGVAAERKWVVRNPSSLYR
jgi:hypothetical protein